MNEVNSYITAFTVKRNQHWSTGDDAYDYSAVAYK